MVVVAILAAGRGTRMKSHLPKVLHSLGGLTLVERVLESVEPLSPSRRIVIVGYQSEEVQTAMHSIPNLEFVEQTVQLGTGHAIQQLLPYLEDYTGDLLILNGDLPLIRSETLKQMLQTHAQNQNAATILTSHLPDPTGYGRVFCNDENIVQLMVEHKDCTAAQRQNHRINAGVYCFRGQIWQRYCPTSSQTMPKKNTISLMPSLKWEKLWPWMWKIIKKFSASTIAYN